jgi:hypothetical protein
MGFEKRLAISVDLHARGVAEYTNFRCDWAYHERSHNQSKMALEESAERGRVRGEFCGFERLVGPELSESAIRFYTGSLARARIWQVVGNQFLKL